MKENKKEDTLKWSLMVGFTIVLAGITGFMVVNRSEFFPGLYMQGDKHPAIEHQIEKDSTHNKSPIH